MPRSKSAKSKKGKQRKTYKQLEKKAASNAGTISNAQKSKFVKTFFEILHEIKLYHWKTKSYSQHKATDELHSKLSELVDSFIEIYIGHVSRRGGAGAGVPVFKRGATAVSFCECKSLDVFRKKLDSYVIYMESLTEKLNGYTDLVNIRDEMAGAVAQALYLLRLA